MKYSHTQQRILSAAVSLFAKNGYEAVTVEQIAREVGMKAPSLYNHFKSKQEIFQSILAEMERRDAVNAAAFGLPPEDGEEEGWSMDLAAGRVSAESFAEYTKAMFRYWTEDEFASAFRRMLTIEQFRSEERNALYHQYLGAGPLDYTADLLGSWEAAVVLYGPMHLLYSVYDGGDTNAYEYLCAHLEEWRKRYEVSVK